MYLQKLITVVLCCFATLSMAQTGAFDLRVTEQYIDLNNQKYYVDIGIKAASNSQTFNLASQNYKLTFDESVIDNPAIDQELTISGFSSTTTPPTNSFFGTHTLTGTIDSFISYNIPLQGGDGYFVDELTWVPVGRLVFDLIDAAGTPDLIWREAQDFPATALTAKAADGSLYQLSESNYSNLETFGTSGPYPMTAIDDEAITIANTQILINVLVNDYALGGSIDLNSIAIVEGPSNGAATLSTTSFEYLPTVDYLGPDSFSYRICDENPTVTCDTATVFVEILNTEPTDDFVSTNLNTNISIDVLANDPNTNGILDPNSLSITTVPSNGIVTLLPNNQVDYAPDNNFYGTDTFSYEVCFNVQPVVCNEAIVTVSVVNGFGRYSLSFSTAEIDEINMKYYVDIHIRADDFSANLANQNYRFSFPGDALANPQIDQELTLSGFVEQTDVPTASTYLPHSLTVLSDTVVAYDVLLDSGDGYLMDVATTGPFGASSFVAVGRISFDMVDLTKCLKLDWHSQDPLIAPATYVEENRNGTISELPENSVQNINSCPNGFTPYIFLEGALDPGTQLMTTTLNELGLLPGQTPTSPSATPTPAGQPYNIAPFFYEGTESVTTYDADIVDWVLVGFTENRTTELPLFSQAALLHNDGRIELLNPQDLPVGHPNPLYLHVVHRSHMVIASVEAMDFSTVYTQLDYRKKNSYVDVAGFGQKEVAPGLWAMYAGDADQEADFPTADISGNDLITLEINAGFFNRYITEDVNLDGAVNPLDKLIWSKNNGISSRVFNY